ncbi:ribonuclease HII [Candidatus Saccharibacteria bacterium 32-49-10]|nr:MAG: ribonuclease HII [Candidatus Saccharibacteria bacterium 32-49-10]
MILGIDEAGRGPWAGPLVVGAVVLGDIRIDGLTDSKKLTKKKRELLYEEVTSHARAWASGWVSAAELDEIGMSQALRLATRRAVEQITVPYSEIIIDGTVNFLADTGKGAYVTTMAKADLLISSVSAASIIAKVERDRYMGAQDELYPGYEFGAHAGYGTLKHREAIERLGVTPLHRLSFAPLARYRSATSEDAPTEDPITTKKIGDRAEDVVASYLEAQGHTVLARNWKTKFCEIDIVSRQGDAVYFTEVKYRKTADQGGGIGAITPKKLRQMRFASEFFMLTHKISDTNMMLAAADVAGDDFHINTWLTVE